MDIEYIRKATDGGAVCVGYQRDLLAEIDRLRDVARVWQERPSGEFGAWQYQYGRSQGGAPDLERAAYQARQLCSRVLVIFKDDKSIEAAEAASK